MSSSQPEPGRCNRRYPDGNYCHKWPLKGKTRCAKHGANLEVAGPGNPAYKHGRYSKYMPPRLQERYQVALQDPTLLSSREDIALLDARLEDLLRRADTGEAGKTWEQLKQARVEVLQARSRRDAEGVQAAFQEILNLIQAGYADHLTWDDIRATVMDRNKLVRSEQRRLVDMRQMVTVDRLVVFVQVLAGVILEEVHDKSVARRLVGRVQSMLEVPGDNES